MKKRMEEILDALKLDGAFLPVLENGWRESLAALPAGELPFTGRDALAQWLAIAGMEESLLADLETVADAVRREEPLRLLAWHAHHTLCCGNARLLGQWPELDRVFGRNCGMFYLMIGLSAIPVFTRTYLDLGIPERYAEASAKWLAGTVEIYRGAHGGVPGHTRTQLHWVRNYIDGTLFRIGRLEFMHQRWPEAASVTVFRSRKSGITVALAAEGTCCSADGMVLFEGQPKESAAFVTAFFQTAAAVEGHPVSPEGFILDRTVRLAAEEWAPVLTPGDFTPGIHIPGGGGMTPEACRASFEEALRFYAAYFPEKKVRAFVCSSWIFNPDWARLLPDSNLAKFQRRSYLYPLKSSGREGLFFLFGREHGEWSEYPRDNSVRRAMLDVLDAGGRLRTEGMFLLPEELPCFDAEPYRSGWKAFIARP